MLISRNHMQDFTTVCRIPFMRTYLPMSLLYYYCILNTSLFFSGILEIQQKLVTESVLKILSKFNETFFFNYVGKGKSRTLGAALTYLFKMFSGQSDWLSTDQIDPNLFRV